MANDDDGLPLLTDYAAAQPHKGGRQAAIHRLPAELFDQVNAAALTQGGPGSVVIHRWLVDEHNIDIDYGAIDYWVCKQRRLAGQTRL